MMPKSELKSERTVVYQVTDHCVMGKDSSGSAYEGKGWNFVADDDAEAVSQFRRWKEELETALNITADHQYVSAPKLIKKETVVLKITTQLA